MRAPSANQARRPSGQGRTAAGPGTSVPDFAAGIARDVTSQRTLPRCAGHDDRRSGAHRRL